MRTLTLLLVAALLASCATPRPDLRRLYGYGRTAESQPVILIPGILGSRLKDRETGKEFWPGSIFNAVFGDRESLTLEEGEEAEPSGLFEGALGQDVYGEILNTLEHSGRFKRTVPGKPVDRGKRRYYVFAYDWRQDNVYTAAKLDALIEQIRLDYGDPTLKVDIVAHSMGGLIARYFLRYGSEDVLPTLHLSSFGVPNTGAEKVRTAILLGTPNLGSAAVLHGFIEGGELGFSRIPPEVLSTAPSVFQLFPHPVSEWLINARGEGLERNLFDPEIWRRFQWSVYDPNVIARIRSKWKDPAQADAAVASIQQRFADNLERARRFAWSLSVKPLNPAETKMVAFGGDCSLTPSRLLVEEVDGESVVRLHPDDIENPLPRINYERLMLEPGDGEVTKSSLLGRDKLDPTEGVHNWLYFPLAYSFFLCEAHANLAGNVSFQDNLLNLLLSR